MTALQHTAFSRSDTLDLHRSYRSHILLPSPTPTPTPTPTPLPDFSLNHLSAQPLEKMIENASAFAKKYNSQLINWEWRVDRSSSNLEELLNSPSENWNVEAQSSSSFYRRFFTHINQVYQTYQTACKDRSEFEGSYQEMMKTAEEIGKIPQLFEGNEAIVWAAIQKVYQLTVHVLKQEETDSRQRFACFMAGIAIAVGLIGSLILGSFAGSAGIGTLACLNVIAWRYLDRKSTQAIERDTQEIVNQIKLIRQTRI